ncbi:MAG: hypothetical protein L0G09_14065 [Acinetobacter sp.]|uniref:hypothetical protein n=1 Tax=unclassified Acinetobacter TaxID=196816 RepID=UPI00265044B3|nr:hypothetical protein [Acinetobacter sp.]MDN5418555.1 hypothetical protein [Acinetobacter sp.]MDN5490585.1 hypothetical protein [Acinetobacter sp.]MDN5626093.1 hypothetical protein [Acinetobacter sp.]MDN5649607.1 hypothetical protein [Acinetobacter sp.]
MPLPLLIGLGVVAAAAAAVALSNDSSSSSKNAADEQAKKRIEEDNEKKRQKAAYTQQQELKKQQLNKRNELFNTEFSRLAVQYVFDTHAKSSIQGLLVSKENIRLVRTRVEEHWAKTDVAKQLAKTIRDLDFETKQIEAHLKSLKEQNNG